MGEEYENSKEDKGKRFAIMSKKQGDLELRILENEEDYEEYYGFLEEKGIIPEVTAEIPTSKTPYQIVSEFKKYIPESKTLLEYSPDRRGFSSIKYTSGDKVERTVFKEAFYHYLSRISPWERSF